MVDSITVVALLHDLCKVGFYKEDRSNKKIYSENGSKQDKGGRFDWVEVHQYRVLDTHKFGHGAASIEIAERFMGINGLTEEEKYAIRYHMGDFANERGQEMSIIAIRWPLCCTSQTSPQPTSMNVSVMILATSSGQTLMHLPAQSKRSLQTINGQGGNGDGQATEST